MQSNIRPYLNRMIFGIAFAVSAVAEGNAQDNRSIQQIRNIETPQSRPAILPEGLLTTIASWLSTNFDLPMIHDHPHVEFVPRSKMAALRYRGLIPDRALSVASNPDAPLGGEQNIVAIYDDARRTIFLPEGWTGATPAEISVLVHEMVHHLQNVADLKYECPQEREKPAFLAQERWLGLFGRSLAEDFDIDSFTLWARSACM